MLAAAAAEGVAASLFSRRCLMLTKVPSVVPLVRLGSTWQNGGSGAETIPHNKSFGELSEERNQLIGVRVVFKW